MSNLNLSRGGLLSVKEAAEYLGISESTIYTWKSQKRIPYIKVGRRVLFRRESLDKNFNEVMPKAA
jgi:excisionase family DNA binding protein